ncbi:MAG: hypothetical protein ACFB6S_16400 [Geminicoccaceae bacterium]
MSSTVANQRSNEMTPALDPALLDALDGADDQRLGIDRIACASGRAGHAAVGRIDVGEASLERLTLEGLATRIHCGSAILRNVRLILELHYTVHWSYDLKWLGSDSGIKKLGSKAKPIELHDITLPMVQDIDLVIPAASVDDVDVALRPIDDLALGSTRFEGLAIDDTRLPSDGFGLSGLGVGSFEIGQLAVPAADSRSLTIDRVSPDAPLRLPDLRLEGIDLPSVAIPDASSDGSVALMGIQLEAFEAPAFKIGDLFKATFVTEPVLHLQIGELVLAELSASASIDRARVENIQAPVTISGLRLGDLELNQVTVERIAV